MDFGVLGPVEVSDGGRRYAVGGPKQRTVLALLIASVGRVVTTDRLIDGVYGDEPPSGARRSIQTYVSNLRREIGDSIRPEGTGYVLTADRESIDAQRFEDAVAEASSLSDPEESGRRLRLALAIWRGHPYADVDAHALISAEVTRLNELRATAIEQRVEADLHAGRHRLLIAELEALTEQYPLRERFRAQHMLALYRSGRQAEALRAYERTRSQLVEDLGLDPSPELRDLEQRILDQDPMLDLERRPAIRRAAILVADIADPVAFGSLEPPERERVLRAQSMAIEAAASENDGSVFAQRGSAVYAVFDSAEEAAAGAEQAQRLLIAPDLTMRMAITVGEVETQHAGEVAGPPVTRGASLAATAHAGQVLLSAEAQRALAETGSAGWAVRSLGTHQLDGDGRSESVHQLIMQGFPAEFPPLRTDVMPTPVPVSAGGLPGYELRAEVGSGAFGVVHRAYQPSIGREVAIKIIRPEFAGSAEFIRRFEVEAQLVARLEHPHIVPLHDYWRQPDGAFLVMRWMPGGSLEDRLGRGTLTVGEASNLVEQIGAALDHAHRHHVVHRDVKAANVLLDDDGNAYLSDFGIAQAVANDGAGRAGDVRDLGAMLHQCLRGSEVTQELSAFLEAASTGTFEAVDALMDGWQDAVGGAGVGLEGVRFTPTRNPYKSLRAFGELDAADFYGRSAETDQLVDAVAARRLVTVVGPSGVGKSSVVRAGLIPALRSGIVDGSGQWVIVDMLPGRHPFEELTTALLRVAVETPSDLEGQLRRDSRGLIRIAKRYLPEQSPLLLIVDQFEELFTLTESEKERRAFLALLQTAVEDDRSDVRVVVTMRADYFDRPLRFGEFGVLLRDATIPIAAPAEAALRKIVVEPAAGVGVRFAERLVDRIVADVKDQPGALPLLEFSLTELFDERQRDVLTLETYEDSGGVLGALGRRADQIYDGFDSTERTTARQVFLRLVNVADSGRDSRRRVRLSELERLGYTGSQLHDVLTAFGDHRLLTFDRDPVTRGATVEVAHEAILTQWPRLAGWIEDHREDLLLHTRLAAAVADWEATDRSDSYLLSAGRLSQHEAWSADTDLTLTNAEVEYLAGSRSREDEQRALRRKRRRAVMAGFGVAAVVASLLAIAALIARNDARDQTEFAEASQLATAAINVLGDDPELALMLAVTSAEHAGELSFEHRRALHAAIDRSKSVGRIEHSYPTAWSTLAWPSPDGTRILVGGDPRSPLTVYEHSEAGWAELWSVAEFSEQWRLAGGFTSDGRQVAVLADWPAWDKSIPDVPPAADVAGAYLYDAATGRQVTKLETPQGCDTPKYSFDWDGAVPDQVIGWCDGTNTWWITDLATARVTEVHEEASQVTWADVSLDGSLIEVETWEGGIEVIDRHSGQRLAIDSVGTLSPGGSYFIPFFGAGPLLDPRTGAELVPLDGDDLHGCLMFPSLSSDESQVFLGCEDSSIRVISTATGEVTAVLRGHSGLAGIVVQADDSNLVVSGSADGFARLWDYRPRAEVRSIEIGSGYFADASIDISEDLGAAVIYPTETESMFSQLFSNMERHAVGELVVFEVSTGRVIHRIDGVAGKVARISPDGSSVIVQSASGEGVGPLRLFDIRTGEEERLFGEGLLCRWEPGTAGDRCGDNELIAADAADLAWSPDGALVAMSGGFSQQLVVWDALTGAAEFVTDPQGVFAFSAVVFSPDGKLLAVSSKTGMWIYDTTTWELVTPLITHTGRPSWVMQFTSDGSELVTAQAHSGDVRIYDTTTWKERNLRGGVGQTRDMAISSDESMVALSANDGNMHVLDLETGDLLDLISLDNRDITNVEFIDDDSRLLISSSTGPIEILTLDPDELLEIARSRVTRGFTPQECEFHQLSPCPTLEEITANA